MSVNSETDQCIRNALKQKIEDQEAELVRLRAELWEERAKLAKCKPVVEAIKTLQDRVSDFIKWGGSAGTGGLVEDAIRVLKTIKLP